MVPILINKDVFEPNYNYLKCMAQNCNYFCSNHWSTREIPKDCFWTQHCNINFSLISCLTVSPTDSRVANLENNKSLWLNINFEISISVTVCLCLFLVVVLQLLSCVPLFMIP